MKEVLEKINNQVNLSMIEMQDAMSQIMSGKVNDIDMESFLIGLNTKGISEEEITAAAMIMREKSLQILFYCFFICCSSGWCKNY